MLPKSIVPTFFIVLGSILLFQVLRLSEYSPKADFPITVQGNGFITLVVPHHDILADNFQSYYDVITPAKKKSVNRIIILAPNHFEPEQTVIKTANQPFESLSSQSVGITTAFLPLLLKNGVHIDQKVFGNEHAVFLHLPLIAKNFPNATITPLLFTRNIPRSSLDGLVDTFRNMSFLEETLVLVSSDFSHGLPYAEAEKRDQETLTAIRAGDRQTILRLNDEYLDCPSCMYVALGLPSTAKVIQPQVRFHGNSTQFLALSADTATTSYYVLNW